MKHAHQTQFGRLTTAVQHESVPSDMIDKWVILTALTEAADIYGLNHRTLGVLKVLMTFLPTRLITSEPCGAIVFPSNQTLSKRLNGMPESTLRRHLAALVAAGIVSRHDSANRKRFARRVGKLRELAFGFDLSPLARHRAAILEHATKAATHHEQLAALRAHVAHLRQLVLSQIGEHPLFEAAHLLLRRKPQEADLRAMQASLEALLNPVETPNDTVKISVTNAQNERHIQYEDINKSDSEVDQASDASQDKQQRTINRGQGLEKDRAPCISQITQICVEYKSYFPEPVRNWRDLACIADRLTPMMGIDGQVFKAAIQQMGLAPAVTAVLCILERLADIRNPGGYLRRLTQRAGAGGFDVRPMLDAIAQKQQLSPDNHRYAYKTVG